MENTSTAAPIYKEWILETIDQLRKRKARPDLERICHMLERKHGVTSEETEADLERLVDAGIVIKVDYKGSTSYRNAAKWRKNHLNGSANANASSDDSKLATRNVKLLARKVRSAVNAISSANNNRAEGASLRDIENWIAESSDGSESPVTKQQLLVALNREVSAGRVKKLNSGSYICTAVKPALKNKMKTQEKTERASSSGASPPATATTSAGAAVTSPTPPPLPPPPPPTVPKQTVSSPGKKGRPPNKRKRFKKTLGPDFEQYDVLKDEPKLTTDDKCDYCLLTSDCNRNGSPEDLLFCKDCSAKAHPSCMDYSQELARRARKSPWQCIDCKTCYICEDSGDADAMLFCDACDKGYHMTCHKPEVMDKPTGKWVCNKCEVELLNEPDKLMEIGGDGMPDDPARADTGGASCLPTPCDSPLHFHDDPKENCMLVEENRNSHVMVKPKSVLATANGHASNTSCQRDEVPDASDWTIQDVADYLTAVGFQNEANFFKEQEIDGKSLLLMKRSDVLTGLTIKLGPALKIYNHVQKLQTREQAL